MKKLLQGKHARLRNRLLKRLSSDEFERDLEWDRKTYREKCRDWVEIIGDEGYGALGFAKEHGGGDDLEAFLAAFETIAVHDLSHCIKYGVQFGLFGGSIHNLGTEKHHAQYLNDAGHARLAGCFAMTETGHGSNVAGIKTTGTWNQKKKKFIINTPDRSAYKDYIGNAAQDGLLASVFCQLIVGGTNHGVHAILVPIRTAGGRSRKGVHIEDDGLKIGLNGVDNGRLAFDHVEVPRENLLDRFGHVDEKGNYSSPIENPNRRFFTMLGTLVGGRISVGSAAVTAAKTAQTVAIQYCDKRRQFGEDNKPEILLLDYKSHQRRLIPGIATTYALHFALESLSERYCAESSQADRRETELIAAALKPAGTWHSMDTIQACREACGGQGYLAENRFGELKADIDVFCTFEGDNTVLQLLIAKEKLKAFQKDFKEGGRKSYLDVASKSLENWITKRNPISQRSTSLYRSETAMEDALAFREEHSLFLLAKAIQSSRKKGADRAQAIIDLQPQMLHYAQAYTDRLVFDRFSKKIKSCDNPKLKLVLKDLLKLYALQQINEDRAWYLERSYISGSVAEGLSKELNKLCGKLRPHAVNLVKSYGIPKKLLNAPIADYRV